VALRRESRCREAAILLAPGAHSSAGERPLHTREVPGSIPGAPIILFGLVERIDRLRQAICPVAVQIRTNKRLEPKCLLSLFCLIEMPVLREKERAAVGVASPLGRHGRIHAGKRH
jgi:hypothetical protein